ncbi:hypothetical protein CR51_18230 [Caballeronia megalochromosomata]|nr:hypothetical protein CR51_18230 [Caballeronia megalochromosomata]
MEGSADTPHTGKRVCEPQWLYWQLAQQPGTSGWLGFSDAGCIDRAENLKVREDLSGTLERDARLAAAERHCILCRLDESASVCVDFDLRGHLDDRRGLRPTTF